MDDDYSILEETAIEERAAELAEDFDEDIDYDELAYWDAYLAEERQAAYDDEWGDPLDMPSYGD